jgi:hypothetical protein
MGAYISWTLHRFDGREWKPVHPVMFSMDWMWDAFRRNEATVEGNGYPALVNCKAKYLMPHFWEGDLEKIAPPLNPEEPIQIEGWDQS